MFSSNTSAVRQGEDPKTFITDGAPSPTENIPTNFGKPLCVYLTGLPPQLKNYPIYLGKRCVSVVDGGSSTEEELQGTQYPWKTLCALSFVQYYSLVYLLF